MGDRSKRMLEMALRRINEKEDSGNQHNLLILVDIKMYSVV